MSNGAPGRLSGDLAELAYAYMERKAGSVDLEPLREDVIEAVDLVAAAYTADSAATRARLVAHANARIKALHFVAKAEAHQESAALAQAFLEALVDAAAELGTVALKVALPALLAAV